MSFLRHEDNRWRLNMPFVWCFEQLTRKRSYPSQTVSPPRSLVFSFPILSCSRNLHPRLCHFLKTHPARLFLHPSPNTRRSLRSDSQISNPFADADTIGLSLFCLSTPTLSSPSGLWSCSTPASLDCLRLTLHWTYGPPDLSRRLDTDLHGNQRSARNLRRLKAGMLAYC